MPYGDVCDPAKTARQALIVCLFAVAVTSRVVAVSGLTLYRDAVLEHRGVPVEAKVTDLYQLHGKRGSDRDFVTYEFEVGGAKVDGSRRMAVASWNSLEVGAPLEVVYDPLLPDRAEPRASIEPERSGAKFAIVASIVLLLVVLASRSRTLWGRRTPRW